MEEENDLIENSKEILQDLEKDILEEFNIDLNDLRKGRLPSKRANRGNRMRILQEKELKTESLGYGEEDSSSGRDSFKGEAEEDSFDSDFFDYKSEEEQKEKKPKKARKTKKTGLNNNVTVLKDSNQELTIEIRKLVDLSSTPLKIDLNALNQVPTPIKQSPRQEESHGMLTRKRKPNPLIAKFKPSREKPKKPKEKPVEPKRPVEERTQADLLQEAIITEIFNIRSLEEMQKLEELNKREYYSSGIKKFDQYVRTKISKGRALKRQ